jgi:ketosteroid isomerase-like protein
MRITRFALAASAIALAACQKPADNPQAMQAHSDSVRAGVEAMNHQFAAHMMAGHVDSVVNMYTSDANVMPPNMASEHGTDAIRTGMNGMLAQGKPTAFTLTTSSLTVVGDHAVETGHYSWTQNGPGGKPMTDSGKYVVEWENAAGGWKIKNDIWNSDNPPMAMPAAPAARSHRS